MRSAGHSEECMKRQLERSETLRSANRATLQVTHDRSGVVQTIGPLQIVPQSHSRSSLRDEAFLRKLKTLGRTTRPALGYDAVVDHSPASTKIVIDRLQLPATLTLGLQDRRVRGLYLAKMTVSVLQELILQLCIFGIISKLRSLLLDLAKTEL
jgi:hypothetical protein